MFLILCIGLFTFVPEGEAKSKSKKVSQHALTGKASWYGGKFHGRKTASGAIYNKYTHTAAHKTLPFGTVVEVTDQSNQLSTLVCITDRGPFIRGRVIDLSLTAANELNIGKRGIAPVKLRVVSDTQGKTLNANEAFFVQIHNTTQGRKEKIGPYQQFADATVMKEVLSSAHPEAAIIMSQSITQ